MKRAQSKQKRGRQTPRSQSPDKRRRREPSASRSFDPTTLEIYRALYTSVAEEMGIALRRTAFSPNIKERRDYSCAVFDREGCVIAQGDHMPVHLGSMPMAVAAALRDIKLAPGDVVALNDPFAGGTHLPDVTLVAGVFDAATGMGVGGRGWGGGGGGGGEKRKRPRALFPSPQPLTPIPSSTSPTAHTTRTSAGPA